MALNREGKKTAGAFDIRSIIGGLLGIYGIILVIVYAVDGNSTQGNNDDNLWTGIVLLVVGLIFLGWARLRPIVVATTEEKPASSTDDGHGLPPKA